jgi:hypothetical protein
MWQQSRLKINKLTILAEDEEEEDVFKEAVAEDAAVVAEAEAERRVEEEDAPHMLGIIAQMTGITCRKSRKHRS